MNAAVRDVLVIVAICSIVMGVFIWIVEQENDNLRRACYDRGGVTTVGRDIICVSSDGRVLP